ncbi:hypothetical protein AALO_G00232480 [Alosa alosa]|uniref:Dolichol kinase n=2 Tax=Alosa alosa TaxID=278164 RepID=A0AAV6G1H6_9TELE|nr:uncharacterized protein si:ch211-248a14.8 isoform X1 [Alosa alosa]KAG5266471.1 hypothetical protein AALO_G00232480 [Alosa alosa]
MEIHNQAWKGKLLKCFSWICKRKSLALRRCLSDVLSTSGLSIYSSECWKSLVPILLFCGILLAMVALSQVDRLRSFVCGIFIPQYHYPYAVPLTFVQVLIISLPLLALHGVGLISLRPYSLRLGERMLVPTVCGSAQAVLELWAKASAHSGLYPLFTCLLPVLSVVWSRVLSLTAKPSLYQSCLLAGVTLGAITITVAKGIYLVETLEWVYSPLSVLLHSLSLAWMAKVAEAERGHLTVFDCHFSLVVTRCMVLGFLCLLHPDGPRALEEGNWHSLLFLGYLLAILLLGALQHLLIDMTALYFSPLAAALLYAARELARPFYSLL